MVAHTSTVNTVISVRRLGSLIAAAEESEVVGHGLIAEPGASEINAGALDGPIALARDRAGPVVIDIKMTVWEEALVRNIIPEAAPVTTLQSIQRDLTDLKAAVQALDPTSYDPGDLVPAFTTNL